MATSVGVAGGGAVVAVAAGGRGVSVGSSIATVGAGVGGTTVGVAAGAELSQAASKKIEISAITRDKGAL